MGGGGALWLGLTRPGVWAAVAPLCADVFPGTEDLAPNALNLPMRFFHGDLDPAVGVESSRQWQRRLLSLESPVEYIEFPGVRHNAWDFAYKDGAIFDWFGKYRRNANPDRVRLVARDLRYAAAYWVRIDALAPGVLASVNAVRSAGGVRVETRDVDAFTLATSAKAVTIDGAAVRLRPAAALSFSKTAQRWRQSPAGAAALQGPIVEAVNARHIYVYGAGDAQTRGYAESAAAWSSNRSRLNLKLPVKSDREVSDDDLAGANLVLFGTPRTNRLIARFAPQFPLALNPGADQGLCDLQHVPLVAARVPAGVEHHRLGDGEVFKPRLQRQDLPESLLQSLAGPGHAVVLTVDLLDLRHELEWVLALAGLVALERLEQQSPLLLDAGLVHRGFAALFGVGGGAVPGPAAEDQDVG